MELRRVNECARTVNEAMRARNREDVDEHY